MQKTIGEDQWAVLKADSGRGSSFGTPAYNERWKQLSTVRLGVALACFGKLNRELGYEAPPVSLHGRFAGGTLLRLLSCYYLGWERVHRFRRALDG
jgi:hypothetical protein